MEEPMTASVVTVKTSPLMATSCGRCPRTPRRTVYAKRLREKHMFFSGLLSSREARENKYISHQHRGGVEYQIGITQKNISDFGWTLSLKNGPPIM
ncbi:MAG: hypothetical protein IH583_12365 [Candidatus Aminicenantes bacterium]|nr:hypothetical protein [Candidatus Aminicenantes bacterium]